MREILKLKKQEEIQKCIDAQDEYTKKNKLPDFAPRRGICWNCKRNIYQNLGHKRDGWRIIDVKEEGAEVDYVTGISLEEAGKSLVTGCPHCHRSYCD